MIRLPAQEGPAHGVDGVHAVVMASRLELRRYRQVPGFLVAALRLRRLFGRSDGAIRLTLAAAPLRRTFFTLSVWSDQALLDRYVRSDEHARVMKRYGRHLVGSTFESWSLGPDAPHPTLAEALDQFR